MCGIVGYIGKRDAYPVLVKGLKRLEYRGYDSAGIALINGPNAAKYKKLLGIEAEREFMIGISVGHAATSKTPHEWDCSHIIDIR